MLFIDPVFLFYFLPIVLALHALALRGRRDGAYPTSAKAVFFFSTLVFYGLREPWWLLPFFVCLVLDFGWAHALARLPKSPARKLLLAASLVQNIGLLVLFRYGTAWLPRQDGSALGYPIGISFYTFESLSFVFDVYRREVTPPRRLLDYAVFLGMFPRFLAGPIARFPAIEKQLREYRGMELEEGLSLFLGGLLLKVGFADSLAVFTRYAYGTSAAPGFGAAWLGVLAHALQLYFDFAGYSQMAVGLGLCFGFAFPRNFDRPYHARTMREFWARWHITLGDWVRRYLYFPLAARARHSRALLLGSVLLSFVVIGLWHGASLNYALMGLWFGAWICGEVVLGWTERVPVAVARALTFGAVLVGWVLGNSTSLAQSAAILGALVTPWRGPLFNPEPLLANPLAGSLSLAAALYCFCLEGKTPSLPKPNRWGWQWARVGFAVLGLALAYSTRKIPFLYFQF